MRSIIQPVGIVSGLLGLLMFLFVLLRTRSLPMAFEIAIVSSVLLYVVLYLVRRREQTNFDTADFEVVLTECDRLSRQINALVNESNQLSGQSTQTQQQLVHIHQLLISTLETIREDEDKHEFALPILKNFVKPIHDWLTEYHKLSRRNIHQAENDLREARTKIPTIEAELERLYERIHTQDTTELALLNLKLDSGLSLDQPPSDRT